VLPTFAVLPLEPGFAKRLQLRTRVRRLNEEEVASGVHNRDKVRMAGRALITLEEYLQLVCRVVT